MPGRLPWLTPLCLFCCLSLQAQRAYQPVLADPMGEPWRWTHFDQLDSEQTRVITQRADGDMLFGVESGVIRYDGYGWERWDKPPHLRPRSIQAMYQVAGDSLYVGTDDGIYRVGPQGWRAVLTVPQALAVNVEDIIGLPDGSLLFALAERTGQDCLSGLLHKRGATYTLYTSPAVARHLARQGGIAGVAVEVLSDPPGRVQQDSAHVLNVRDLALRRNGQVLAAISDTERAGRLLVLDYGAGRQPFTVRHAYGERDGLRIRSKVKVEEDLNGDLWVISNAYELGLYRFDGKVWRSEKLSDRFGGVDSQSNLMVATDGSVWIDGHGRLFRYQQGTWMEFKYPDIPITTISRFILYEDRDHHLWIAGRLGQVYRFDNTYATWASYPGLNFQVGGTDSQRWYLSIDGRAVVERGARWTAYGTESGLIDTPVRLLRTSYGELWASGSHEGVAALAYFDGQRWHHQKYSEVSWGFDPRAAFEAHDGSLWFGCSTDFMQTASFRGGVIRLPEPRHHKDRYEHHAATQGTRITTSYGIGQSLDGRIWVGGKPLWTYDGQQWRIFDSIPAVQDYVDYVETTPAGELWLGSRFYGIFRFDGAQWTRYTMNDGIVSNNTLILQAEGDSTLWATTYGGYGYFDGRNWSSGLFPTSLAETQEGASLREDEAGLLWFNHTPLDWKRRELFAARGVDQSDFSSFRTVSYRNNKLAPQTQLLTDIDEVETAGDLTIFWEGTDHFNATKATDLRYAWRLNGGAWSDYSVADYQRFASLSPGDYLLEVRARDRDNQVDPSPAVLSFSVLPVWWKRWEFVLLLLLAGSGLIILQFRILSRNKRLFELNHQLEQQSSELQDRSAEVARQRDRLRETVKQVSELSQSQLRFFTNVSHEFRTPLNLIIGPVEELLRAGGAISAGRLKRYHGIVLRNANRILQLIEQILDIYKVEETTLDFAPAPGDLALQCAEMTALFQPLAERGGVSLSCSLPPQPLAARFDADKVEKILFNLLSNAFKNVPSGGRIEVGLTAEREERMIRLCVRDNGRGIPPDKLDRIFERFFHTQAGQNSPFHTGLGIGLAYVTQLVKAHGGQITAESQPGVATTFTVALPWLPVGEQALPTDAPEISPALQQAVSLLGQSMDDTQPPPATERAPGSSSIKILVVEDDDDTRHFLSDCFAPAYTVIEAADGQQGLELARQEAPDLIVSDVSMPGMDGFALCRRLKADFDTSHIPVILLTARTAEHDKITGYETGADAYVDKPCSWQLLRSRVGALIRQRDQLRQRFRDGEAVAAVGQPELLSVDQQFMQRIHQAVEDHLDNAQLDAEQLAHEVGVSRIQLYRKLKALSGQTVSQFIRSVRLRHAAGLLEAGELTVAEVAYRTGFNAPNHFSTYFKKKFGVPPSQYPVGSEEEQIP
ncbi:Sensor histidine kinase RcsC [Neolewinella maritima]|uniref:histidine kinase n=1 Tax=Neolewinella maritima TaxID=1383882 RepID=A0ABN8F4X3_9BACT|nr:ATP-binding protein [Neolewinella maritima]CAH1001639.1 Sensor histidine kinase RcsC [Neolewinella maritima]